MNETDHVQHSIIEQTDASEQEPEYQMPLIMLFVFGLPLFMTIVWFFMQFTRPDRFGRVDRHLVDQALKDQLDGEEDEEV
ncbi:MAG: hypothetical protein ACI9MC_001770 [Kiritimatiellia bacterium]